MNLETLVLELVADDSKLSRDIDATVNKAIKKLATIEKTGTINPSVNFKSLHELNKLLDIKQQHIKETARVFNNTPIVVMVDASTVNKAKSEVAGLKGELSGMSATVKAEITHKLEGQASRDSQIIAELRRNNSEAVKANKRESKKEKGILGHVSSGLTNIATSPIKNIVRGFQEGMGQDIAKDFSKGVKSQLELIIEGRFGSTELIGKTVADKFAKNIASGVGFMASKANEYINKELEKENKAIEKEAGDMVPSELMEKYREAKISPKYKALKFIQDIASQATQIGADFVPYEQLQDEQNISALKAEKQQRARKSQSAKGIFSVARKTQGIADLAKSLSEIDSAYAGVLEKFRKESAELNAGILQLEAESFDEQQKLQNAIKQGDKFSVKKSQSIILQKSKQADSFASRILKIQETANKLVNEKQSAVINAVQKAGLNQSDVEKAEVVRLANFKIAEINRDIDALSVFLEDLEATKTRVIIAGMTKGIDESTKSELQTILLGLDQESIGAEKKILSLKQEKSNEKEKIKPLEAAIASVVEQQKKQDIPDAFNAVIDAVTGGKRIDPTLMPKIVADDKAIKKMGDFEAVYDAAKNQMIFSSALMKRLKENNLTLQDVMMMIHEFQHAYDFDFGSAEGLQAYRQGVTLRNPVKPSNIEDDKLVQSHLLRYAPKDRRIEASAYSSQYNNIASVINSIESQKSNEKIFGIGGNAGSNIMKSKAWISVKANTLKAAKEEVMSYGDLPVINEIVSSIDAAINLAENLDSGFDSIYQKIAQSGGKDSKYLALVAELIERQFAEYEKFMQGVPALFEISIAKLIDADIDPAKYESPFDWNKKPIDPRVKDARIKASSQQKQLDLLDSVLQSQPTAIVKKNPTLMDRLTPKQSIVIDDPWANESMMIGDGGGEVVPFNQPFADSSKRLNKSKSESIEYEVVSVVGDLKGQLKGLVDTRKDVAESIKKLAVKGEQGVPKEELAAYEKSIDLALERQSVLDERIADISDEIVNRIKSFGQFTKSKDDIEQLLDDALNLNDFKKLREARVKIGQQIKAIRGSSDLDKITKDVLVGNFKELAAKSKVDVLTTDIGMSDFVASPIEATLMAIDKGSAQLTDKGVELVHAFVDPILNTVDNLKQIAGQVASDPIGSLGAAGSSIVKSGNDGLRTVAPIASKTYAIARGAEKALFSLAQAGPINVAEVVKAVIQASGGAALMHNAPVLGDLIQVLGNSVGHMAGSGVGAELTSKLLQETPQLAEGAGMLARGAHAMDAARIAGSNAAAMPVIQGVTQAVTNVTTAVVEFAAEVVTALVAGKVTVDQAAKLLDPQTNQQFKALAAAQPETIKQAQKKTSKLIEKAQNLDQYLPTLPENQRKLVGEYLPKVAALEQANQGNFIPQGVSVPGLKALAPADYKKLDPVMQSAVKDDWVVQYKAAQKNLFEFLGKMRGSIPSGERTMGEIGTLTNAFKRQIKRMETQGKELGFDVSKYTMDESAFQGVTLDADAVEMPDITKLKRDAKNVGQSVSQGVGQGVTVSQSMALEPIEILMEKSIDVAKEAIDSNSPSKKFIEVGKTIGDGLKVGFEQSFTKLEQSVLSKLKKLSDNPIDLVTDKNAESLNPETLKAIRQRVVSSSNNKIANNENLKLLSLMSKTSQANLIRMHPGDANHKIGDSLNFNSPKSFTGDLTSVLSGVGLNEGSINLQKGDSLYRIKNPSKGFDIPYKAIGLHNDEDYNYAAEKETLLSGKYKVANVSKQTIFVDTKKGVEALTVSVYELEEALDRVYTKMRSKLAMGAKLIPSEQTQPTQKIEENWEKTKKAVQADMVEITKTAEDQAYPLQRNMSEGSPGPTDWIRKNWEKTAKFVNKQIESITTNSVKLFAQGKKDIDLPAIPLPVPQLTTQIKQRLAQPTNKQFDQVPDPWGLPKYDVNKLPAIPPLNKLRPETKESQANRIIDEQIKKTNELTAAIERKQKAQERVNKLPALPSIDGERQKHFGKFKSDPYVYLDNNQPTGNKEVDDLIGRIRQKGIIVDKAISDMVKEAQSSIDSAFDGVASTSNAESKKLIEKVTKTLNDVSLALDNYNFDDGKFIEGSQKSLEQLIDIYSIGNSSSNVSLEDIQAIVKRLTQTLSKQPSTGSYLADMETQLDDLVEAYSIDPNVVAPDSKKIGSILGRLKQKEAELNKAMDLVDQREELVASGYSVNDANRIIASADDGNGGSPPVPPIFDLIKEKIPIIGQAIDRFDSLKDTIKNFGMMAAAGIGLALLGKGLYEVGKNALTAYKNLEGVFIASKLLAGSEQYIANLRKQALQLGSDLRSTLEQGIQFSSALVGTPLEAMSQQMFQDFSTSLSYLGLQQQQYDSALLALKQVASKGRVSLEEITGQLGEAVPGIMPLVADALGTNVQGAIQQIESGNVLAEDLLPKLAAGMKNRTAGLAPIYERSLTASTGRLGTSMESLNVGIGEKLAPAVIPAINLISSGIIGLSKNVDKLMEAVKFLAIGLSANFVGALAATVIKTVTLNGVLTTSEGILRVLTVTSKGLYLTLKPLLVALAAFASFEALNFAINFKGDQQILDATKAIDNLINKIKELKKEQENPVDKKSIKSDNWMLGALDFVNVSKFIGGTTYGDLEFDRNLESVQQFSFKANESLSGIGSVLDTTSLNNYVDSLSVIDSQIAGLQGKMTALRLVDAKKNSNEIKELGDQIKGLNEKRTKFSQDFFPLGADGLSQAVDNIKAVIELTESLQNSAKEAGDKERYNQAAQELSVLNSQLAVAEKAVKAFDDGMKSLGNTLNNQRSAFIDLSASIAQTNVSLSDTLNTERTELTNSQVSRGLQDQVNQFEDLNFAVREAEKRVQSLQKIMAEQKAYIASDSIDTKIKTTIEIAAGKNINDLNAGDIKRMELLAENDTQGNLKAAYSQVSSVLNDIVQTNSQVIEAKKGVSEAKKSLVAFSRTEQDYFRNTARQIEDLNLQIEAQQLQDSRSIQDLSFQLLDASVSLQRSNRALIESYRDMTFDFNLQIETIQKSLDDAQDQLKLTELKTENLSITPGNSGSIARQINDIFLRYTESLFSNESSERQIKIDILNLEKERISRLRQIRDFEEKQRDATRDFNRQIITLQRAFFDLELNTKNAARGFVRSIQEMAREMSRTDNSSPQAQQLNRQLNAVPQYNPVLQLPVSGQMPTNGAIVPTIQKTPETLDELQQRYGPQSSNNQNTLALNFPINPGEIKFEPTAQLGGFLDKIPKPIKNIFKNIGNTLYDGLRSPFVHPQRKSGQSAAELLKETYPETFGSPTPPKPRNVAPTTSPILQERNPVVNPANVAVPMAQRLNLGNHYMRFYNEAHKLNLQPKQLQLMAKALAEYRSSDKKLQQQFERYVNLSDEQRLAVVVEMQKIKQQNQVAKVHTEQQTSSRPLGTQAILNGEYKYWAGEQWKWQSEGSYRKLLNNNFQKTPPPMIKAQATITSVPPSVSQLNQAGNVMPMLVQPQTQPYYDSSMMPTGYQESDVSFGGYTMESPPNQDTSGLYAQVANIDSMNDKLIALRKAGIDATTALNFAQAQDSYLQLMNTIDDGLVSTKRSVSDTQLSVQQLVTSSKGYLTITEKASQAGKDSLAQYENQIRSLSDSIRDMTRLTAGREQAKLGLEKLFKATGRSDKELKDALEKLDITYQEYYDQINLLEVEKQRLEKNKAIAASNAQNRAYLQEQLNYIDKMVGLMGSISSAKFDLGGTLVNDAPILQARMALATVEQRARLQGTNDGLDGQALENYVAMSKELAEVDYQKSFREAIPFVKELGDNLKEAIFQTNNFGEAFSKVLDVMASQIFDRLVLIPFTTQTSKLLGELFGMGQQAIPTLANAGLSMGTQAVTNPKVDDSGQITFEPFTASMDTAIQSSAQFSQGLTTLASFTATQTVTEQSALTQFVTALQIATQSLYQFAMAASGNTATNLFSGGISSLASVFTPSNVIGVSDTVKLPMLADGLDQALTKETRRTGQQSMLAVINKGESVLSTLNGDAQKFQALKRSGQWDAISLADGTDKFYNQSRNYRGRWDNLVGTANRQQSQQTINKFNQTYTIVTPNADSFRKSQAQIQDEGARTYRRKMR